MMISDTRSSCRFHIHYRLTFQPDGEVSQQVKTPVSKPGIWAWPWGSTKWRNRLMKIVLWPPHVSWDKHFWFKNKRIQILLLHTGPLFVWVYLRWILIQGLLLPCVSGSTFESLLTHITMTYLSQLPLGISKLMLFRGLERGLSS